MHSYQDEKISTIIILAEGRRGNKNVELVPRTLNRSTIMPRWYSTVEVFTIARKHRGGTLTFSINHLWLKFSTNKY